MPQLAFASSCSSSGYTVEYINGVSDTLEEARANATALQFLLRLQYKDQPLIVKLAYNPEHVGGVGDAVQVVSQMMFSPISDYDVHNVLRQMAVDDTTRKLLLIGHSQGALYANSIYEYITAHGEPARSIDVFAVATPASYVAGGGKYVNSVEDAVIFSTRLLAQKLGIPAPLPDNVSMVGGSTLAGLHRTHLFSTYLDGAGEEIVAAIISQLDELQSEPSFSNKSCFTPPVETVADRVQQHLFAIADPVADVAKKGVALAYDGTAGAVTAAVMFAGASYSAIGTAVAVVKKLVQETALNPAAPENQEKNFAITKKLYGSSVNKEEYGTLNKQGAAVMLAFLPSTPPEATSTELLASTTPPSATTTSTIATTTSTVAFAATTSAPSVAPLFFGGSSLPSPPVVFAEADEATSTPDDHASTTPPMQDIPTDNASTTTPIPPEASSSPPIPPPPTPQPVVKISDTFDSFNSLGWQQFGSSAKNFEFDDGSNRSCFSGGCAIGMAGEGYIDLIPRMYIETSPGQESGAYTLYAKVRNGFLNNPTATISICEEGGTACMDASASHVMGISFFNRIPADLIWHQYYVAWRQGSAFVQSCIMRGDIDPADCDWQDTEFAVGTKFDGIALWSRTGFRNDLGANLWFDELVAQ